MTKPRSLRLLNKFADATQKLSNSEGTNDLLHLPVTHTCELKKDRIKRLKREIPVRGNRINQNYERRVENLAICQRRFAEKNSSRNESVLTLLFCQREKGAYFA